MNSLEIKTCLQKYYVKVAESIVLGKEEVKKKIKIKFLPVDFK